MSKHPFNCSTSVYYPHHHLHPSISAKDTVPAAVTMETGAEGLWARNVRDCGWLCLCACVCVGGGDIFSSPLFVLNFFLLICFLSVFILSVISDQTSSIMALQCDDITDFYLHNILVI